MAPTGAEDAVVYMLGEAPGEDEDALGQQFVGASGVYLRPKIPSQWRRLLRWNNVVRTRPPDNRTPTAVEMECCRPSVQLDIEATKPKAIFAFGGTPLEWLLGEGGIGKWRGRRAPVRIGKHTCWAFFFHHPSYLLRTRRKGGQLSEDERMFAFDLKRAFDSLETLPKPHVYTGKELMDGIRCVPGEGDVDAYEVAEFLKIAATYDIAGIDYETVGTRPYTKEAKILSAAVSIAPMTMAFPIEHPGAKWNSEQLEIVLNAWREFLAAPGVRKAASNVAFEQEWSGVNFGRHLLRASRWDCTMVQAFITDQRMEKEEREVAEEGALECFSLRFLSVLHLGIDIKKLSNVKVEKLAREPLSKVLPYNGLDAKCHRLVCAAQDGVLAAEGLTHVYELHMERVPTCVLTQMKGVPLNLDLADRLDKEYSFKTEQLEGLIGEMRSVKEFRSRFGKPFNPASNTDMLEMCRDILKRTEIQREKKVKGKTLLKYSVDKAALSAIPHELPKAVLELRRVTKLGSTYVFSRRNPVVYPDGCLHPLLNTCRTRTSRLSSSDPNSQNWPQRDLEGKRIREQVEAPPGYIIIAVDEGQIEARVFPMASRDPVLIKAYWEDYDIHMEWAQRIASAVPSRIGGRQFLNNPDVMKKFRYDVKGAWVFALFFGAALETCAMYLQMDPEALRPLHEEFWRIFSAVRTWQEDQQKFYKHNGYVQCLTGRRRYGPLSSTQQINTPIQGTMAEIVLDCMNRISCLGVWDLQPMLNVHDDLTFLIPEDKLDYHARLIVTEMTRPTFSFINVPLIADMSVGKNLFAMQSVGKFSGADWHGREAHLGLRLSA